MTGSGWALLYCPQLFPLLQFAENSSTNARSQPGSYLVPNLSAPPWTITKLARSKPFIGLSVQSFAQLKNEACSASWQNFSRNQRSVGVWVRLSPSRFKQHGLPSLSVKAFPPRLQLTRASITTQQAKFYIMVVLS